MPAMIERLIIGAMSGTSADAVDAVLTRLIGSGPAMHATPLASVSVPLSPPLREAIVGLRKTGGGTLRAFAAIGRDMAEAYADAVRELLYAAQRSSDEIDAIAAHGQTLFHDPPLTIQQFDPAYLAERTGIDVISDFRRADLAAGGQGAPLVPFADYLLFRSEDESRVVLNLGGIANVTILPAGCGIDQVTGFDTGPANCLSDAILGGVDDGGRRALAGMPSAGALETFCGSPYVRRSGPKSTDGPAMLKLFSDAVGDQSLSIDDRLATAAAIVTECVLRQTPPGARLLLAGGGAKNEAIVRRLRAARAVSSTDALGIPTQDREAVAFAVLGAAFLDRFPANLPAVTGAARRVVLGALWPATTSGARPVLGEGAAGSKPL